MRWMLCLLMCIVLLAAGLPFSLAAEASSDEAPTVRVLLRRLQLTDRADLTLEGVYTVLVNGQALLALPEDVEITVQIRSGELYLFYRGMSLRLGKSAVFQRNQSSTEMPGLRFSRTGNLYPGTLSLSIENGLLVPVLTLSVEDYLLGVVPYEMSDSFPLEALKAQAVCARTYALSHLNPSRAYDVVDTTNDQVFRGVDASTANAARAVEETAGIIGTYNGKLAECFYSASNGGQTELVQNVWSGSGDYSYYAMVDDPYDLENPLSIVRTVKIGKDGSMPDALKVLLHEKLLAVLIQGGYSEALEDFRIDSISAVSAETPLFDAPSRRMSELVFTFTWSGRKQLADILPSDTAAPAAAAGYEVPSAIDEDWDWGDSTAAPTSTPSPLLTETPTTVPTPDPTVQLTDFLSGGEATVTLNLSNSVITALSLHISGSEVISVTEEDSRFLVQARRYGHGVGMSQRGAQWMASRYSKTFDEILAFYYPGMTLMKTSSGDLTLPTVPPSLADTPAPAATATPKPTLMPVTTDSLPDGATVMYVNASSLNLRAEPSMAADLLMRLQSGQQVIVLETCDDPEWVHVRTDVIEGYCMVSYLAAVDASTVQPSSAVTTTPDAAQTPSPDAE